MVGIIFAPIIIVWCFAVVVLGIGMFRSYPIVGILLLVVMVAWRYFLKRGRINNRARA